MTKTNIRQLRNTLEVLSSNLIVMYDEALQRIERQNQGDRVLTERALRWIAFTYRPLTAQALQQAVATEPDARDFDTEAQSPIGLILDVCAGLLIYDEADQVVRLVHYTTQDYFDGLTCSRFDKAHSSIAVDCMIYLSYTCFQHDEP